MYTKKLLAFLLYVAATCCGWVHADDPPYSIELISSQPTENFDKTWFDWDTMVMRKIARNKYAISGDFVVNRNIGNQQKLQILVFAYDTERKQRGPMVFEYSSPFCKFVQEDKDTYPGMTEKSNLPKNVDCPFPKNTYTFEGYEMETTFLPDDTPKGDYLIVVYLKDNEMNVAGYELEITLADP